MEYVALAKRYHPNKVKVLFIGESPPNRCVVVDGVCKPSYFYAEYDNSYSLAAILNYEIFEQKWEKGVEWKKNFLKKFCNAGHYLIDLYPNQPIDKNKSDSEIRKKREDGVKTIGHRIKNENPEAIVILMESLCDLIKPQIHLYFDLPESKIVPVKFPLRYPKDQERQKKFRDLGLTTQ